MKTDESGRAFITKEEGEILHTYKCAAGVLTIGVGHTGADVHAGMVITKQTSQALLSRDLARFEAAVNRGVTRPLTQPQFNALVSFAFNLGEAALAKSSLLHLVNAGNATASEITRAFKLWRNVNGKANASIEARRGREAALYLS
jgi:lysozyme